MQHDPIIIVGGGVGGLATAARLAHRGENVLLLEKNSQLGGRNRHVTVGGSTFDGGPSLMMMLEPFQTLFKDLGEKLEDHLTISLCDPSYRVFYRDGTRLDGTPNVARMLRQIEELSGPKDAANYPRLIGDLSALYHASIPTFVRNPFTHPLSYLGPGPVAQVLKHRMLGNLAKRVESYFDDPRLRMLFSFQTMYLGLSPYDAPWVYATLTFMEYGDGIWFPQGGLPAITDAIAHLACTRGAQIRLGAEVTSLERNQVVLASGETIRAKAVVSNADLPFSQRALSKKPNKRKLRYSCSAFVLYLDYAGKLPDLLHHNVFFGQDFKGNLDDIFHRGALPSDPAFYACISSRSQADRAPEGHENLFLLIPCANLDRPWTPEDASALKQRVFDRLATETGFDPSKVVAEGSMSPIDWRDELNLEKGAAFGISHDFLQSAFFRPGNRDRDGIYYVGASTIPGNGLPMVLISAELVERRLMHDGVVR